MSDGIIPLTPAQTEMQEKQAAKEGFIKRDLIALDMFANVLSGGHEDETISSRLARDAEKHEIVGEIGSKALDLFQHDHGAKAVAGDEQRSIAIEQIEEQSGVLLIPVVITPEAAK